MRVDDPQKPIAIGQASPLELSHLAISPGRRRPPGRRLTGGLDVSDDRLGALVHMNMFNPHKLRAAVSQPA
jgi:hypothetical protein